MFRYRKSNKKYIAAPRDGECPFCSLKGQGAMRSELPHAYVIENIFGYDVWEYKDVIDHLMAIPRRHVKNLDELNAQESREVMQLIAEYEKRGYNVYARGSDNAQKSVPLHQHTHLIKTAPNPGRGIFFWRKPYFMHKF